MNFFKKYILLLLILPQTSIKSAHMFKKTNGDARDINIYNQNDLKDLNSSTIPLEETIIAFGPNDKYAKIAFLEKKSSNRYQVHYFTLLNPKKSAEFSNLEDAQYLIKLFMLTPVEEVMARRSYFTPLPARGSGQGWRSTSSKSSGRRK